MPARLSTPLVTVVRASEPDKVVEIQCTNVDLIAWDRTRLKHRWPAADEVPMMWLTFVVYKAAQRTGVIGLDYKYEAWEQDVLAIDYVDPKKKPEHDDSGEPFPEGFDGATSGGDSASDSDST